MADLVELQHSKLDLLVLVLLLLWLGVCLLLTLLGSTKQTHQNVHSGGILDSSSDQASVILQLTTSEHDPLLAAWDTCTHSHRSGLACYRCEANYTSVQRQKITLASLNNCLDILDSVGHTKIYGVGFV